MNDVKKPHVRNFSARNSNLGQEIAAQIMGGWDCLGSFWRKRSMPIKFLVLGGFIWFLFSCGGCRCVKQAQCGKLAF